MDDAAAVLDPRLRNPDDSAAPAGPSSNINVQTPSSAKPPAAASTSSSPDLHRHGQPPPGHSPSSGIQGANPPTPTQAQLQTTFATRPAPPPSFSPPSQNAATPGTIVATAQDHATLTPPSAASGPQAGSPGEHDGTTDPKKPRACEACRGLKVRCEPDPMNPEGPCKRCAKAGRRCIVTQPTRKRQKKTDSRVAELEKKIDALTATLSATRAGQVDASAPSTQSRDHLYGHPGVDTPRRDWSVAHGPPGSASRDQGPRMSLSQSPYTLAPAVSYPPPMVLAGQKRKYTETRDAGDDAPTPSVAPSGIDGRSHEYSDVIDRGIITMERAHELWERYTTLMVPHLPGVVFPPTMTVGELRKTKPVLFLSIMCASSSETPNVQRTLVKELMQVFADKVIITGEKSIELVQALNVAVIWYWPPEHFEELKFYQLVHMAAVMAIDIGLGKRRPRRARQIPYTWRDQPFRKYPPPDPTTIEARRAWLTCYFLTTNTAMALHRPSLLRWTSFMTECVDVLESSPEAAPTDKYLCHLVWSHRLAEEIGIQFSMDDPAEFVNIADVRTQHALRGFERELEKYSKSIPHDLMQPSLKFGFHTVSLYMHELALQTEPGDAFKAPFAAESLRDSLVGGAALTPAHINALSACLTAIDGIFETFLSMEIPSIRCLPVFNFVRVAYATVVLIRVYFAASSPNSELGKVINKDNMKVEQYLESLLEKFRVTAADDKSRPASKFLVVLVMIRSWFQKQGKAEAKKPRPANTARAAEGTSPYPASENARAGGSDKSTPQTVASAPTPGRPDYSATANTPLQLLSEVATNNQAQASASSRPVAQRISDSIPGNEGWYNANAGNTPQGYNMYEGAAGDSSATPANGAGALPPPPIMGTPAPWLNFSSDFDYSGLGDGFAQEMDMTISGLVDGNGTMQDFNGMQIMANDPLFGPLMGEMPGSNIFQF